MSRHMLRSRDTPSPEAVTVTCDNCGGSFTTDESAAYSADQRDEDILCKGCENGQPAPPSEALEDPEIDAIRDDLARGGVGPDAEPPIEVSLSDHIGFGDLPRLSYVEAELSKGTESLGTITVALGDVEDGGLYLPVSLEPATAVYTDEVQDAVVSELSRRTQLLIELM